MNHDSYLSVKQVAEYLHLNEKKVYELVKDNQIPATKVTGKWLFPRNLIDRWITESAYNGLLSDRLAIVGSDDPLFYRAVLQYTNAIAPHGLVSYFPTGTGTGLKLLQMRRADACCLHWGRVRKATCATPRCCNSTGRQTSGCWCICFAANRG
ncbi:helix-turn-helix domain-containing protein [Thiothrix subterranea]|uniref:helix-turn-helix domain-containing protein n=1 Tax=Thiothrix subterranea TaxID=2735563 RepID=UPI00280C164A|nr:helix-turn-helix domain-containing protein [Thiothrix subterranea]